MLRQELAGLTAQCQGQQEALDEQLAEVSKQLQEAGAPAPRGVLKVDGTAATACSFRMGITVALYGNRQVLDGLQSALTGRRRRGPAQQSGPDGDARKESGRGERRCQNRRSSELPLERTQHGRDGGTSKRQRLMSNMQS